MDLIKHNPDGTSEAMNNEHPDYLEAQKLLRRHFGLPEIPSKKSTSTPPSRVQSLIYWVDLVKETPPLPTGEMCMLYCGKEILRGEYRIALVPGRHEFLGNQVPDYYHIRCFEKSVDFSKAGFLDRVLPLSPKFTKSWNSTTYGDVNENCLLDVGAEKLVLQWKFTIGRLIDQRDGVENKPLDPALNDLLQKAGSSKYVPKKPLPMCEYEYQLLTTTFAPIESDGPEDSDEWNLFEKYLSVRNNDQEGLKERHSLSKTLEAWQSDKRLVTSRTLTVEDERLKEKLSPKAIRAIKRLATP